MVRRYRCGSEDEDGSAMPPSRLLRPIGFNVLALANQIASISQSIIGLGRGWPF